MGVDVEITGLTGRQLPDANIDGAEVEFRQGRYGELYQVPMTAPNILSDEGTYFVGVGNTGGVAGTGITFAINTSPSETAGYFINLKNNDSISNVPNARRLYLDYIKLICITAPASATAGQFYIKTDNINRFSSGGSSVTPFNGNLDSSIASIAQLNIGALTTVAASTSARQIGRGVLRAAIPVVNDVYIIKAGSIEANRNGGAQSNAAAVAQTIPVPPVVIGPQMNIGLQLWFPGNAVTAPVFEVEMAWWER